MTSAPMSASISVQVGPAMTCVRSTTFNPDRGPIVSPAILLFAYLRLFAGPLRRAFIEKRIHTFAEIPALVTHQDQILVLANLWPHPKQGLLGRAQRQRRMACDEARQLAGPPLKGREVVH